MLSKTSVWRYFDVWLLAAVLLLTAYGILMIRSAITGAPALPEVTVNTCALISPL